jgi:enoyl-CoA hydratase/carnithine racemase
MPAKDAPPAESPSLVLREDREGIATLTLNRPTARNALSLELMREFQENLDALAIDNSIRAVVIAGNGPVFCAGHDLKELRSLEGLEACQAPFRQCSHLMLTITRLPQPVIAKVHGMATAAGCQLVATCDLALAAVGTRFATPGVRIGLFCSTPMVALSRAVPRKQALEMLLTGDAVDAETAARIGLINHAVAPEELDRATEALAAKVALRSSATLKIGKEAFYRQIDLDLEAAYGYASEVMAQNMMAKDAQEGIDAFLEKREPRWTHR